MSTWLAVLIVTAVALFAAAWWWRRHGAATSTGPHGEPPLVAIRVHRAAVATLRRTATRGRGRGRRR